MRSALAPSLVLACWLAACGSNDGASSDDAGGSSGQPASSGGSSSGTSAGSSSGTSGGSSSGTSGASGSRSSGGDAGAQPSGGSSSSGGVGSGGSPGAGTSGTAGGASGPPDPTEDGLSAYTVECSGDSRVCDYPAGYCLGIKLDDGDYGYGCSSDCETTADCSDAPSGAEAAVGCVSFTARKRCVLVCYDGGDELECPTGMSCYRYPDSPVGYCLYL